MKQIIISLDVETEKEHEEVRKAILKGIYYGLDTKGIAEPKKVKINYCLPR